MAAATTPRKKKRPSGKTASTVRSSSFMGRAVQKVPVSDLLPHPQNPRIGNVEEIAESLKENGQFKPIFFQQSTNHVLMGNHTLKAARLLGWKEIDALPLDVDDEHAKRILLADNRYSDMATYNTEVLADILKGMPDVGGTGYNEDDVRSILAGIEDKDVDLVQTALRPATIQIEGSDDDDDPAMYDGRTGVDEDFKAKIDELKERRDAKMIAFDEDEPDILVDQAAVSIATIQTELEELEGTIWESTNEWGIPDLIPEMLLDEMPEFLNTWGGEDATPDDGKSDYIWNFGLASTKNLPWHRAIMSFFTYDTKFDQWWDKPAYNLARVMHNGIERSIVPDYSMWVDDPRFFHLQAAYKAQWLGRFMQEAGIRVIPRLMWCDPESIAIGRLGIPKYAPIVAVCIQAIDKKEIANQMSAEGLRLFIKELKPESLIVYSGNPGKQVVADAKLPKELTIKFVDNYAAVRRHVVYDNQTGKTAVEKAQREVARRKKKRAKEEEAG